MARSEEDDNITIQEILSSAQNAADNKNAYHFLLQSFFQKPLMTKKCFYLIWIGYITEIKLERPPNDIQNIDCNAEDLDNLCKVLLGNCNTNLTKLGMRLVECPDEETGDRFITIVSERPGSNCLIEASNFTADQRFLLDQFIDEIMTSKEGYFNRSWAVDRGRDLPNAMSAVATDTFLQTLVDNYWFKEKRGFFTLGVRGIAELTRMLIKKYDPDLCLTCKRVIILKKSQRGCVKCRGQIHLNCFKLLCAINDEPTVKCPNQKCRNDILKDEQQEKTGTSITSRSDQEMDIKEEPDESVDDIFNDE